MDNLKVSLHGLLRKSERFFKTDMVYLARGSFWLNGGQILTSLFSFGLALLFAKFVSKEAFGNYRYILSLAGLMATFSLTGLSTGIIQAVARGFSGTYIEAVRILLKWNSLIFVFSLTGAIYYLANGNMLLGYGLVIISILYPGIKVFESYESFLSGKKDFKKSSIYRGIVDICTILATAMCLFFTEDPIILVLANLLTQFILDAVFFRNIYKSIPDAEKNKVEPGIIKFSKHLSIQNVLSGLPGYVDKIIVFHFLGASALAIYTFSAALPLQIKGLMSNFSLMIMPKISERTAKESVAMIPKRFFLSLTILVPIIILYIIFAPLIFHILFPTYSEAVPYTRWYVLVLLIMGNLSGLVLVTQKATKYQYILTLFGGASQIILMLVLVQPFGLLGIIWAYLISKFTTAILSYILVIKLPHLNKKIV